ncbi:MAG: carbon storage regulator [Planctomycetaceae bacterium]
MLVLARKSGDRIRIGDEVVVTVVRVGSNSVRLGIEAPRSVNVVRDELQVAKSSERLEGSQTIPTLV